MSLSISDQIDRMFTQFDNYLKANAFIIKIPVASDFFTELFLEDAGGLLHSFRVTNFWYHINYVAKNCALYIEGTDNKGLPDAIIVNMETDANHPFHDHREVIPVLFDEIDNGHFTYDIYYVMATIKEHTDQSSKQFLKNLVCHQDIEATNTMLKHGRYQYR